MAKRNMSVIKYLSVSEGDTRELLRLKVNKEDLADDFYDYSKVVVRKPWGYEYLLYTNGMVAVWILYIKSQAQTSMHCHPNKTTSLIVMQGSVECSSLDQKVVRAVGEGLFIDRKAFHQTKATSEEGAFVMEIETPVNKRDLVRLRDQYGREGKGYESSEHHSINTQNYNYLSLNGPAVEHNQKKRFGECSLTIRKFIKGSHLDLGTTEDHDVLCVLKGEIGSANSLAIGVGHTCTVADLKAKANLAISQDTEVLVVRKMDSLIKVSDCVANFLKANKVREVFLVPGDANVHLMDSIGRAEGIRFTALPAEREASLAAEGFSKANGQIGVLVLSSGGSGPNALAGITSAWIDSTPLLVISGQARSDQGLDGRTRQLGNKAFNILEMVKSVTKYAVSVTDPTMVQWHLEKAAQMALSGRPGPVWVEIPIDIQGMTIARSELQTYSDREPALSKPLEREMKRLRKLFEISRRPVILAGNGIRLSGAEQKFVDLVEKLGIPVLLSRRGADLLPDDHALCFGRPGTFGQRRANFILQNADLLISIGSRLAIPLIGRNTESFARAAKKVVVDIDAAELEKNTIRPELAINVDAAVFIQECLAQVSNFNIQADAWLSQCQSWSSNFTKYSEDYRHGKAINPYLFLDELSSALPTASCVVIDGGAVMHRTMQIFNIKPKQRLISSTGLELPGFALAGAVGACVARQRAKIFCICEDRGFQASIAALQTIVDNKLPVTIFVLRSRGHLAVRSIQKDFFGARFVGTDNELLFESPSISGIGKMFGYSSFSIASPSNLAREICEVLKAEGPVICEVEVDSEQELSPRMGFTVKDDGKWLAKPLEDMYPFLDREILKNNMLIDLIQED